jgi:alkane 1-monooxygenase
MDKNTLPMGKFFTGMGTIFASDVRWHSSAIVGVWAKHLLCFSYPLGTMLFLATAPHPWYVGVGLSLVVFLTFYLDFIASPAKHQPIPHMPDKLFTAVLYLLVALQLINYALVIRLPLVSGFFSWDVLFALVPIGITAGYSGIVVAHELIHRPEKHMQILGRILLIGVLYEHWAVEHLRGHHKRVGTWEDPVTAPMGETFSHFYWRVIPAQIRSAWKLEQDRLGNPQLSWYDLRQLKNGVVRGFLLEFLLMAGILGFFGLGSATLFFLQHLYAHTLLEAVNYFEHYGLVRQGTSVHPTESWDSDSWFSFYSLVGLTRHSDHHTYSNRPYQKLRVNEESPRLPCGYFGSVVLVIFFNKKFRRLAKEELARRKLGVFAET